MEPTDPPTSMNRNAAVTNLLDALAKLVGDLGTALAFLVEELREERRRR